jgi:serine/threonine protein kinase
MNLSDSIRKHVAFSAAGVVPFPDNLDSYLSYDCHANQDPKTEWESLRNRLEPELWSSLSRRPSLTTHPAPAPTWRIDGAAFGTKYFAIPLSLAEFPPLRIDVVIPDQLDWAPELWDILGASDSVHMHDQRVAELGISRYLILLLDNWARHCPDFERFYRGLPFGSSIVVGSIGLKLSENRITINRNIELPSHLLSIDTLQEMWKLQEESMPAAINLQELRFVKRLYASICLIEHDGKPMVFKSNTQSPSSIYHEIKVLLSLPPHPNIVGPPKALVTITGDFYSGKNLVCGFLLEYYELGSLEAYLPQNRESHSVGRQTQLRWSLELTSALKHIHSQAGMFYSDLKMDNILLRLINGKISIVLVDFEQSRNLYTWAPPEVFYVEWIAELSFRGLARNDGLADKAMLEFRGVIERYFSSRGVALPVMVQPLDYNNPEHGWYYPWLTSTRAEQESGSVYCLGRAIWCIFEGVGNTSNVLGRSHPHDSESQDEFPVFTSRTPDSVQNFIKKCTSGAREWTDYGPFGLFRRGGKVYPRGRTGVAGQPIATVEETKEVVKRVWELEIVKAKEFLLARQNYENDSADTADVKLLGYLERPTLKDVLDFFKDLAVSDIETVESMGWEKICHVS